MRLYHFTAHEHLVKIEAPGVLQTTESNLSIRRAHAGPDVVWLTSDPNPDAFEQGLTGSRQRKTAVRITVEIPDSEAYEWVKWSRSRGITKAGAAQLENGRKPETWFVVTRQIGRSEWVAVEAVEDGAA